MKSLLSRLLLVPLVLAACTPTTPATPTATSGGADSTPAEQRAESQVLRVAASGLNANFTPQGSSSGGYQYWAMYDNLTQFGPNFEVLPSVAEKWDLSADGLTWRFTLRNDVKWPDGSTLTSEDVVFTWNEISTKSWPQRASFATTTEVKATDARTVEFTTRQKDITVPFGGPYFWILPKKYYESVGGFDGFLAKPQGSGPYDLVDFKPGDVAVFKAKATPHAWRKPIATEIQIRAIPDNTQVLNGLRTGEIDLMTHRNMLGDQADQLKREGLTVYAPPGGALAGIFGHASNDSRNTPLTDIRVRQALNYSIDRVALTQSIYRGYAKPEGQLSSPGVLYYDPSVPVFPYDVAKAKQLLAEAGYPNGFEMTFNFTPSMTAPDTVVAIQGFFKEIGVTASLTSLDLATYVDKAYGRNNQVLPDLMFGGTSDPNGFPSRTFQGCGKPIGGGPNSTWYCNPEWDRLLDAAQSEPDAEKRAVLMRQANKVQRDDMRVLICCSTPTFFSWTNKVRGMEPATAFQYSLDNVYKVR